jgi:phosphoribosylaminoimidazolecarboxamide formyltransferase/IMP cyclohydrolase
MSHPVSIKRALVSVFYKDGLEPIIKKLHQLGVEFYSTGGTQEFIEGLGIPVTAVEDLTGYPSILGGRVKTLHPKVFGGILNRRSNNSDIAEIAEYEIPGIDLVIVDLYPFEATVASGAAEPDIIEKIDIGGISLIRAAAKNFNDVVIVSSKADYAPLLTLLEDKNGQTDIADRRLFAARAFNVTSHYDSAIFNYFNRNSSVDAFKLSHTQSSHLRYGENPHQQAAFYGKLDDVFQQMNGKELSYNNLLDADAAMALIRDFEDTTFAIIKHNNACGVATRPTVKDAYLAALAADPVSAFGGILITNRRIDVATAQEMDKLFFEILIAPEFELDALEILKGKKNRIILATDGFTMQPKQVRTLLNGLLVQDFDTFTETAADLKPVTTIQPTAQEVDDLLFANKLVKHTKSNAIILVKGGQLLASGTGQTSRVDALEQAIAKAKKFGFELNGAIMASDAFFPFPDCVEIAHNAGIHAVIQPGGSIKDQESIDYCNNNGMAMVTTGHRHFKH